MNITKSAIAGTLESSDAQVTVCPGTDGIRLTLSSPVLRPYGERIRQVVLETLRALEVDQAEVTVVDRGALDCTLRARVTAAVYRSMDRFENIPWGGLDP